MAESGTGCGLLNSRRSVAQSEKWRLAMESEIFRRGDCLVIVGPVPPSGARGGT